METNIDKQRFSRNCEKWVNETEPQVIEWLFTKYLYQDIKTIIKNVTYYWDLTDPRLTFDDVEADLLMHLIIKREKLRPYSGNWYNIVFTMMKRKLYDILRSHRDENQSLSKLHEFCNHNLTTIEDLNTYELEEPEQPEPEPKPEVLPEQGMEADPEPKDTGRAIMQVVRGSRKANTRRRGGPHHRPEHGLQLTFGFFESAVAL
jgi:DNA-directed RNA polymerase specialized sigma24 family protein